MDLKKKLKGNIRYLTWALNSSWNYIIWNYTHTSSYLRLIKNQTSLFSNLIPTQSINTEYLFIPVFFFFVDLDPSNLIKKCYEWLPILKIIIISLTLWDKRKRNVIALIRTDTRPKAEMTKLMSAEVFRGYEKLINFVKKPTFSFFFPSSPWCLSLQRP